MARRAAILFCKWANPRKQGNWRLGCEKLWVVGGQGGRVGRYTVITWSPLLHTAAGESSSFSLSLDAHYNQLLTKAA